MDCFLSPHGDSLRAVHVDTRPHVSQPCNIPEKNIYSHYKQLCIRVTPFGGLERVQVLPFPFLSPHWDTHSISSKQYQTASSSRPPPPGGCAQRVGLTWQQPACTHEVISSTFCKDDWPQGYLSKACHHVVRDTHGICRKLITVSGKY